MATVTAPMPVAPPVAPPVNDEKKIPVHKKVKYPMPKLPDGTEGKLEFWPSDPDECRDAGLVEPWNSEKYRVIPRGDFADKFQHVPLFHEADELLAKSIRIRKDAQDMKDNPTQRVSVKKLESHYAAFKELEAMLKSQGVNTEDLLAELAANKS